MIRREDAPNKQRRQWDAHSAPPPLPPATEIERLIVDQIKAVGHDPAFLNEIVAQASTQAQSQLTQWEAEQQGLERELGQWNAEIRKLVSQIRPDDSDSPAIARLADLQDRVRCAERRATEVREQVLAMSHSLIDPREVAKAMSVFDPVWDSLTLREQVRIVNLLVERVDYDGATGKVAITFHPSGIKMLANDGGTSHSEDAA